MAPEAPNVQNRYIAESAGIARPDVIAVVYACLLVRDKWEIEKYREREGDVR
jgi:hypothetical protein